MIKFNGEKYTMVDTLNINLEYCYGIGKLEAELKFTHKGYAIYAPNGVMKTSFAKTMLDLSKGKEPIDLAFPERNSIFEVTMNNDPIEPESIFVVKSYDEDFSSDEVSTLLANADLKKKYENVHKDIGNAKNDLDKKLRELSGLGARERLDPLIEDIFDGQYYDALLGLKDELDDTEEAIFSNANYKIIFDPKVVQLFTDDAVGSTVEDFAQKYDELTESSPILRKDFQYHNVNHVQQQLEANKFFLAGHSVNLVDENTEKKAELTSDQSLREKIEEEKLRVLGDDGLREKFDAFNSKLKNKELQAFRDYITENQHLLPELGDLDEFKRKLWLQYLRKSREEYDALINKYTEGQAELSSIVSEASADTNDWDVVIAEFNQRFLHLPFQLSIENKADVILKNSAPSIAFIFDDGEGQRVYVATQRKDLLRVLSTGEQRALYILNIMFEVHTRWKLRKKTLFVFDDIADSFDYKNKFAIIDYLEFLIKIEDVNFLTIILTHNFDFLRVIESRGICKTSQCRMAFKNESIIELTDFKRSDIRNPFDKWKARLGENIILAAYIPFLRNVIEYTQGVKNADGSYMDDYITLTNMLHYKDETEILKISKYQEVFERTFTNLNFPTVDLNQSVLDLIFNTADECLAAADGINLEHKIVLSMAIRIWAEKYMIEMIRSEEHELELPSSYQTIFLINKFIALFNNQTEEINLVRRINLITPSNIHINAFMYEPILDMGFGELKALYQDVKQKLV